MADILKAKLDVIRAELVEAQTASNEVTSAFLISTSRGVQLDEVGAIFKVTRNSGEGDGSYRLRILNAYKHASDCGTTNGVITAAETYTGKNNAIIRSMRPAGVEVRFYEQGYIIPPESTKQVKKNVAAGVTLNILLIPDDSQAFKFDTPGQGFDGTAGFISGYAA